MKKSKTSHYLEANIICICKVYESFQSFLLLFLCMHSLVISHSRRRFGSFICFASHLRKKSLKIFIFVCASSFALEMAPAPIGSR